MNEIISYAITKNASDIHITQNRDSWVRINGEFIRYDKKVKLSDIDEFIELIAPGLLDEYIALRDGRRKIAVDGAIKFSGRRLRINIYKSVGGINIALRLLSDRIKPIRELYLPEELGRYTLITSGLFLVVGTTGSGKSTTLASIIDVINRTRSENILTIEEPIEYIHRSDRSRIEQIEVGVHTDSFSSATVAAMRQNPNIILVGELRDLDTIQNAITLAETGHVVYATLHAKSVTDTIDRIIDVFPEKQQEQIRIQLAGVLKGIMHQHLLRSETCGVVPLVELLGIDDVVASMILSRQKSNSIRDHLRTRSAMGNVHIADNAAWHIGKGRVTLDDVKPYMSPDDFSIVKASVSKKGRGFDG